MNGPGHAVRTVHPLDARGRPTGLEFPPPSLKLGPCGSRPPCGEPAREESEAEGDDRCAEDRAEEDRRHERDAAIAVPWLSTS